MAFISNGTTILDNGAFDVSLGSQVLIKEQTASSSASISFVDGSGGVVLDNTYPIYKFEFINIHPATDTAEFTFQGSTDGGSNYNTTATTTFFESYNLENGLSQGLAYQTSFDAAQSTSYLNLIEDVGNDDDQSCSGTLTLFNPSSVIFVKHFICDSHNAQRLDRAYRTFVAGYFNNTNDIDAVSFKFSSGDIDSGTIKLYGIKDS
jgi:hypothetical protein